MAHKETIRRAFQTFVALELRETPSTPEALSARLLVWEPLMLDVSDADFELAVIGYLRDPIDSEFFPRTPGKLMKYAPGRKPPLDDSSEVWGEVVAWVRDPRNAVGILYGAATTGRAPWAEDAPVVEGQPARDSARDAAIRAGVRAMGGCVAILNVGDPHLSSDTEAGLRKAFRDAYASAKAGGLRLAENQAVAALTDGGPRRIERRAGPGSSGHSALSTVVDAVRPVAR